ncbi:MAG: hypothetical protein NZ874_05220 [Fimbriimonadales bacterium]|nr:hypothetical protein [Fimbriimonadales bacterium]
MPSSARRRRYGSDTTVQATSWHGHLARASRRRGRRRYGLDTTVQATLCLGETPKPRVACAGETPTLHGTTS